MLEPHGGGRSGCTPERRAEWSLTLGYLTYGVGAGITLPPVSGGTPHVNLTLSGGSRVARGDSGRGENRGDGGGAAMLVPHPLQTIEWDSDTAQFALRVPRVDLRAISRISPGHVFPTLSISIWWSI
ncbi:hypothetical protein GS943_21660 [Rhodococcus hoagii]|nr:hypothetical protein [Prescottella equi]